MAGFDNDVIYGINADYSNTLGGTGASTVGQLLTNGQIWVGSTAPNAGGTNINALTLTAGTGITLTQAATTFTIGLTGGGIAVEHLTGNTGGALNPDGSNNFNILTANTTVKFAGVGSTLTQDFNLGNLFLGSSGPSLTSGTLNVAVGPGALNGLTTGIMNTCTGNLSGNVLSTGSDNSFYGTAAGVAITLSNKNTCVGSSSLNNFTTGAAQAGSNTAIGYFALRNVVTGINNTSLGALSGQSYTTSESSNITIGNSGTVGESNIIRIGTQGTGTGQQNKCFLAGVLNTVSGRVVAITTPGAYPYTTLITDDVIIVDTSSARTINLIATPVTGTTYRIKDNVGSAATNNITITPNAGNIDGSATFKIASNWGSADVTYNGTQWIVL